MRERDLFANFDRMRRDMDELFGDVLERTGLTRRRLGFVPAVDVAYTADPPRAVVTAELAGVDADSLELEVQGRKLILSGRREPPAVERRRLPAGGDRARLVPPGGRARRGRRRRRGAGAL